MRILANFVLIPILFASWIFAFPLVFVIYLSMESIKFLKEMIDDFKDVYDRRMEITEFLLRRKK